MIILRRESLVRSKATFYPELMLLYFWAIFCVLYPIAVAFWLGAGIVHASMLRDGCVSSAFLGGSGFGSVSIRMFWPVCRNWSSELPSLSADSALWFHILCAVTTMVSLPLCSGTVGCGQMSSSLIRPLETLLEGSYSHCGTDLIPSPIGIPVLCCLMSSVEKPLFHVSCPFSYLFPMALLFLPGPKVKSFPQFWRPVHSNLVQDPMFCQAIDTVSICLYHLGTWDLWGHLCAPNKPQAAWRKCHECTCPHTCCCCGGHRQAFLWGCTAFFGHPPLAHLLKPASNTSVLGFRHAYLGDCFNHSVTPEGLIPEKAKEGAMMLS